ncbi:MAG: exodeoxyribonuclease III [Sterolibacterium sp.]|nr:exodeoxyribonuclease III [Sterolibacterium sp.]
MKIATWNVNSLKVRLPQVLDWLAVRQPDVLCLQELKLEDKAFPLAAIEAAGYRAAFSGQKTYNGVAILSRSEPRNIERGIVGFEDIQQRLISATVDTALGELRIVCAYMPNGQSIDSDKYQYKLRWLAALTEWLRGELQKYPRLALLGDYNIAPEDRDVYDPSAWRDQVLCSAPERTAFRGLIGLGLSDAFRRFEQPENIFSWWDYRMMAFRRNMGLRIDHILLSPALAEHCAACTIDKTPRKLERPSDHAPVIADIA